MFFRGLEQQLGHQGALRIAVAGAQGEEIFSSLRLAEKLGIAQALFIGNPDEIRRSASRVGMNHYTLQSSPDDVSSAQIAVKAVVEGEADLLMKGGISTALLLKAVLAEKSLMTPGQLLSHMAIMESPEGRLLGITDGGMNIAPGLHEKQQILQSAVQAFQVLGRPLPKVAVLAAMEKENPKIPESVVAGELSRLQDAGEIQHCIVEGPMALDLAVNHEACRMKGFTGKITGDADILLAPNLSAGNILGKSLVYLGGWRGGGVVSWCGKTHHSAFQE